MPNWKVPNHKMVRWVPSWLLELSIYHLFTGRFCIEQMWVILASPFFFNLEKSSEELIHSPASLCTKVFTEPSSVHHCCPWKSKDHHLLRPDGKNGITQILQLSWYGEGCWKLQFLPVLRGSKHNLFSELCSHYTISKERSFVCLIFSAGILGSCKGVQGREGIWVLRETLQSLARTGKVTSFIILRNFGICRMD